MLLLEEEVKRFFQYVEREQIELYNEFSLQHELGIFLRDRLLGQGYKIQFERNIIFFDGKGEDFVKSEMDICIFNADKSEKYAIELKFPNNGQRPEQMFSFIKDIVFMEQMKKKLGFNEALCVTLVKDRLFYSGDKLEGIYRYFRNAEQLMGTVMKPTGAKKQNQQEQKIRNVKKQKKEIKEIKELEVAGQYLIEWQETKLFNPDGQGEKYEDAKFYVVTV